MRCCCIRNVPLLYSISLDAESFTAHNFINRKQFLKNKLIVKISLSQHKSNICITSQMLMNIETSHLRYIIPNFTESCSFVTAYENSLFSVFTTVD